MKQLQKAKSLKDQIYDIVKEDIINQTYKNNTVLNEKKISQALNVSKTPVREALKALEAEGWVEYVPYKGILVKQMSLDDLKDVFRVRKCLEIMAVELAVKKITPPLLQELHNSMQRQEALLINNEPVVGEFIDYDLEFHGILLKISGSHLLKDLIGQMRDKSKSFGMQAIFSSRSRYKETITEHRAVYEAVAAKDLQAAKEAMAVHIDNTFNAAMQYLSSRAVKES